MGERFSRLSPAQMADELRTAAKEERVERVDVTALQEKARQATPGPWRDSANGACFAVDTHDGRQVCVLPLERDDEDEYGPSDNEQNDAAYIAACDPTTIDALCTEVTALRDENARLRANLINVRAFKRADGSELLPDWMRRDIDAALTGGPR